jgi:hypothetical protein
MKRKWTPGVDAAEDYSLKRTRGLDSLTIAAHIGLCT